MRRTFVFVAIAFLAGLGIGSFVRGALGMLQRRTHAADLAAIKKLEQEEIEVTLSQDPKGLRDLLAEDAVNFSPGSPPAVGKQAPVPGAELRTSAMLLWSGANRRTPLSR